jgi:hypothetical protein
MVDAFTLSTINMSLGLSLVIIVVLWAWIQSKIYETIKERHPKEYEKLGNPRFWKMWNPGYTAVLYGTIKFPDDPALSGSIIGLRILTIFMMIIIFVQVAINFMRILCFAVNTTK